MNHVAALLAELRRAADRAGQAFPKTRWTKLAGPGPGTLELVNGSFAGLKLEPGRDLRLRCRLKLPARFAGEPLEATLSSLYPVDLAWNGQNIFADEGVPVAAGPALFTAIPELRAGDNGVLDLRLRVPKYQTQRWFSLRLSTPSLRAEHERLDLAWSQLALADAFAETPAERALVERAAGRPDPTGRLAPLHDKIAATRVHLVGHSHIDMNWLWTWPDTVAVICRDFRSVLALMDEFPELTFSHSQAATYEVIRQQEPALFAKVIEHLRAGRWESLAMQWTEGDVNMAAGEAQARQLLEAVRYSREVLGAPPATFHAPDTFGHAGNLPQLIAAAGGQRYYLHRCNPGQREQWPAFWWEGADGTRVLGISTPTYNGAIHARDLAHAVMHARQHGLPVALHFHGIGDHGGGPARQDLQRLRQLQKAPLLPTAFCSTLARYGDELLAARPELPVHRGELQAIFEGCYTTHADAKLANRQGENLLISADTLAALAGLDCRHQSTAAWRKVLFHQFHDIFDGSAINAAYQMTARDFAAVRKTAAGITDAALTVLQAGLPKGQVAVTNPLGFERDEWVAVAGPKGKGAVKLAGSHGHTTTGQFTRDGRLGFVARVPAFATVSYRWERAAAEPALAAVPAFSPNDPRTNNVLADAPKQAPYYLVETPAFRAWIRRDCGVFCSLFDKRARRELVSYGLRRAADYMDSNRPDLGLNVFQFTGEHPHRMSSWQLHELHTERSLLQGATLRVVEAGPARLVIEARHKLHKSTIKQHIIFYRDLARIDFRTWLDWREPGNGEVGVPGLKVAFTGKLTAARAWFETPFAAAERPADGQENVALRWADLTGDDYGLALLNDCKHGYDALGSRLRLTLVRSAYDPDSIADLGRHEIGFSLVPHCGDWRAAGIVRAAASFNQPLLARVSPGGSALPGATGWRPELTGTPNIQVAGLKPGTIIRLYESAGTEGAAKLANLPAGARVWETNLVEDRQAELPAADGAVGLKFRPWQVRTLLVAR